MLHTTSWCVGQSQGHYSYIFKWAQSLPKLYTWDSGLQVNVTEQIVSYAFQVQPNSVAECSGLQAGDGLLAINNFATDTMSHEDAKMEIIRSGNDISLLIQRYYMI